MILFSIYAVLSAVAIALAANMEREGLRDGVAGANGFVLFIVMLVSAAVIFPLALGLWIFAGGQSALAFVCGGGLWLYALGWLALRWMRGGLR